jgi:hypothetical protein
MKSNWVKSIAVLAVSFCFCGCDSDVNRSQPLAARSLYIATSEPSGAIPVGDARQMAKSNDQIAIVGHIGGSAKPFVDGVAAFTIVDEKVAYCAAAEGCPTPWDYCCEQNAVKQNIATIQMVDAAGKLVVQDAKVLLGVKELSLVVAQGKTVRDAEGNLVLLATKVFLKGQAK